MQEFQLKPGVGGLKADPPVRTIAHVVNVFDGPLSSSAFVAQPAVLESMKEAQDFARGIVDVRLLSTQLEGEVPVKRPYLRRLPPLRRTVMNLGEFRRPRPLPILKDILDRAYEAEEAEFIVYTNIDIGLQPHFYRLVDDLIDAGYDAFVINRRTLDPTYATVAKLAQSFAAVGRQHPGMDCFVFRRPVYPQFRLGNVAVGVSEVGLTLAANMSATAERFAVFHDLHATFHWGHDAPWRDSDLHDYWEHNTRELEKALSQFQGDPRLVSDPYLACWLHRRGLLPDGLREVSAWKPPSGVTRTGKGRVGAVLPVSVGRYLKRGVGAVLPASVRRYLKAVVGAMVSLPGEPKDDPLEDPPEGSLLVAGLRRIRPTDVFLVSFPGSGMDVLRSLLYDLRSGRCRRRTHMREKGDEEIGDRSDVTAVQLGEGTDSIEELKDPRLIATHDTLFHLAPRCVYLVRDPRDVMEELFRRALAEGSGAGPFSRFLRSDAPRSPVAHAGQSLSWSQHVRAALRFAKACPHRIIIVRYEDLRDRPHEELSRVLRFSGIWGEETREGLLEAVNRWDPMASTAEDSWRQLFDETDLKYVAVHGGPAVRALDYEMRPFLAPDRDRVADHVGPATRFLSDPA